MLAEHMTDFSDALRRMALAARAATQGFNELVNVVAEHREQWLCEYEGQWPDRFTLLNRYVRTDLEPPFIINS